MPREPMMHWSWSPAIVEKCSDAIHPGTGGRLSGRASGLSGQSAGSRPDACLRAGRRALARGEGVAVLGIVHTQTLASVLANAAAPAEYSVLGQRAAE